MKIVMIVWQDAVSVDEWIMKSEVTPELHKIVTVGMLVADNESAITVALSHDTTADNISSFIHIPKAWIVSREEISLGTRRKQRKPRK